ncbi:hypothetical protein [Flavobacterium humi]|uniref:Uncharacterized protein n=1 Tax=Flavobacterium humi TaxID=2562683 RepID=A0A4Z0LAR3_9FLAO|nr:hypothetical protein [Flavobacterium humi]TGD58833.1 hypothetical protein E4635_02995 [Flavobacterium humi]
MKEYFKYEHGYVNINNQDLFLTNSGNWSETLTIEEKSSKTIRKNNAKNVKIYIYFLLVICLMALIISRSQTGAIPLGLILLAFGAFLYMKRDLGNRYKIPLSKIKSIEISANEAKIIFLNESNVEDSETIRKIESKGIPILSEIIDKRKR